MLRTVDPQPLRRAIAKAERSRIVPANRPVVWIAAYLPRDPSNRFPSIVALRASDLFGLAGYCRASGCLRPVSQTAARRALSAEH